MSIQKIIALTITLASIKNFINTNNNKLVDDVGNSTNGGNGKKIKNLSKIKNL